MTTTQTPAPSPAVLALAADSGLGAHTAAQPLGYPVSTARLVAAAVLTAACVAWIVFASVGGWGLLLLAMGLGTFLLIGIKMFGTVQLYRNYREIHQFEDGVVVVARGRPTAFRWEALTLTPNWLDHNLLDVKLTGADGSEEVLVAGRFGADTLVRLNETLQGAVRTRSGG